VRYAVSRDAVVVAGIADQSQQGQGAYFPAAYPEVLAVAGVSADGSPSAASLPAGVRVDLTAPGTEVLSLGTRGPGHLVGSGAAYAAAFVAGTAALVRAYHPHLSAVDIVHRLEVTADPPAASLPDPQLGWGTVDPYAAVADLLPEERGPVVRPAPGRVHPPGAAPAVSGRFAVTRFGGGAIGVAVLVVALGCVLPRGRRRRWRVGGRLTGVEAAETEIRAPPAPRAAP
jgi:membrane-anchored mycosin MYCP